MSWYAYAFAGLVIVTLIVFIIIRDAITVDRAKAATALSAAFGSIGTALGNVGRWIVGLFKRDAPK